MNEKKRNQFVDIAKGIAMICIVLGHLAQPEINRIVFTFHVPIFFLITGYFTNTKKTRWEFTKNKFKTLIVPYMISSLAIIVLSVPVNEFIWNGDDSKGLMLNWFKASLFGAGDPQTGRFEVWGIGAIWFLLATFWASLVLRFLLDKKREIRFITVIIIFFISCWSAKIIWLPLSIQAGGCALLFMYIGYVVNIYSNRIRLLDVRIKIAWSFFAFIIWFFFIKLFEGFWLVHCNIGRGIGDIFASICACYCVLLISRGIELYIPRISNGLAYLGRYSLLMLCAHIVELDIFPWILFTDKLYSYGFTENKVLFSLVIAKLIWIFCVTIIFSKWNFSRHLFGYPSIVKQSQSE